MILIGTEHKLTLAYSKEENAMVENANKRIQEYLRDIMFERRTRMTPAAEMLFGNAVDLDRGIFLPNTPVDEEGKEVRLSEWAASALQIQRDLLDIAAKLQKKRDHNRMIQEHNPNYTDFTVGSFVLVSYPQTGMGRKPPLKLHPRLRGPYQVVNRRQDTYTVRNLLTDTMEDFHATSMHPYHQNAECISPQEVVLRDKDMFQIEAILEHRGNTSKMSTLEFKVKWLGYDDSVNSWEPWKAIRATAQLHNYLVSVNLHKLIPKNFRHGYPQTFAPRVEVPEAQVAAREPRPKRNAKKVRFQEDVNVINEKQNFVSS